MRKAYVAKSKITGKGLFAKQNIEKGEIVLIMKGKIIKMTPKNRKKILADPNVMGIEKDVWIYPYAPYVYMNHSCDPNTSSIGKVTFVALRNIKKDEELTFDYSISEDTSWTMKCCCGSKKCRGVIRGTRYLPVDIFKKYYPIFPTYFKKLYLKINRELLTKRLYCGKKQN